MHLPADRRSNAAGRSLSKPGRDAAAPGNPKEESSMNVLILMAIIILAYWIISMYLIAKKKDWE